MPLTQLSSTDFSKMGNRIQLNRTGFCMVVYTSNDCKFCAAQKPILEQLIRQENRCKIFELQINKNRQFVAFSNGTDCQLKGVPSFHFFNQGVLCGRLPSPKSDAQEYSNAITTLIKKINQNKPAPQQPNPVLNPEEYIMKQQQQPPPQEYRMPGRERRSCAEEGTMCPYNIPWSKQR
jgi:hypothetical protein